MSAAGGDEPAEPSDEYLVEHIRDTLAADPRVAELELQVSIAGNKVVVSGTVATAQRRRAISQALAEMLPDRDVANHTTVLATADPREETLQ